MSEHSIEANQAQSGVWVSGVDTRDFYISTIRISESWGFFEKNTQLVDFDLSLLNEEQLKYFFDKSVEYLNSITKNGYIFVQKQNSLFLISDPSLPIKEKINRRKKSLKQEVEVLKNKKRIKRKMKSAIKRNSMPWDLLDPNTKAVPEKVWKERYSACESCEFFAKKVGVCKKCGCFMKVKASMAHSFCPVGKWHEYIEEEA